MEYYFQYFKIRNINEVNFHIVGKEGYQVVHMLNQIKNMRFKFQERLFLAPNKIYRLFENGDKYIFAIHATYKKWKVHLEVEIIENNEVEYELIFYAFYLMRLKQANQKSTFVAH